MIDSAESEPNTPEPDTPTHYPGEQSTPALLTPFAELCRQLAATTKKLQKRALMAAYLRSLPVDDAALAALYLAGAPFAETDRRQLQVGGSTLSKALAELTGAGPDAMHQAYRRHGDLGDAAFDLLVPSRADADPTLTLKDLAAAFAELALARGPAAKLVLLRSLLTRATPLEARYIIKLATGDMRTGVKQSLVEEAIAACYAAEPSAVRRAVMLQGDLAEVVAMAAAGTLDQAPMRLFHPLGFMLASPVDSVEEALARFAEEVALEAAGGEGPAAAKAVAELVESPAPTKDLAVSTEAPAAGAPTAPSLVPAPTLPSLRAAQLEDKYDGMRAQLHCGDPAQPGRVGLFSRNREDLAESFPELIEAFAPFGEEVILDGEILAWQPVASDDLTACDNLTLPTATNPPAPNDLASTDDLASIDGPPTHDPTDPPSAHHPERSEGSAVALHNAPASLNAPAIPPLGRALPFSSLQQRLGRKRVTAEIRATTPVVFMAFDLLYHSGELLLEQPLSHRRARLESLVAAHASATTGLNQPAASHSNNPPAQGTLFGTHPAPPPALSPASFPRLLLAPAVQLADAAQLDAAYTDARARGNEGVMLKASASPYQPGRRGLAWLKLKRELATLDVVITGAEFGNGRRAALLSDYTFAVGTETGELRNVGKAYSGLTDLEIDALSRLLMEQTIDDYGNFRTVEPTVVLEVAFNNVMRSDRHASGFALRFPRILRIRDDKPLDEIDTLQRVEEIYASQPDKPVES